MRADEKARTAATAGGRATGILGIVADDVTGATTVGALIAREDAEPTILFEHRTLRETSTGTEQVLITSTGSRAMEPEVAFGRVHQATRALLDCGAPHLSKRIDTTCRGGIGPEVEGMLSALEDAGEDRYALIVPAMPQSRRIVVGGYSLIDSVLLSETDVARDVRTPVRESHLPTLLRAQFSTEVAHVGLADVLAGGDHLVSRLREHHDRGVRAIVLDAVTLEHVDAIAQAAIALGRPYVCVDPGPLTVRAALRAGHLAPGAQEERGIREDPAPDDEGTVLVVAGSASSVTHDQMGRLRVEPGTRVLSADVLALIGSEETFDAEVQRVLEDVRSACAGGMPRVALLALDTVISGGRTPRADLEAASGLTGARIGTRLTHRFARLARRVLEELGLERTTGLYLTGGDVMIDTVQALGARGLRMVDYVIPQVDQARLIGGPFDGLAVVCKGGLTGTDLTALHCVNRLFDERKSHDEH